MSPQIESLSIRRPDSATAIHAELSLRGRHHYRAPQLVKRGKGVDVAPVVHLVGVAAEAGSKLETLASGSNMALRTFESVAAFLKYQSPRGPAVAVVAASRLDSQAFELQRYLAAERPETSVIFVSDDSDVALSVRAIKAGAFDFLTSPVDPEKLLCVISEAMESSQVFLHRRGEVEELRLRYESLSPRERQVMTGIVSGLLNKQVAGALGIQEITVKVHRRQVMQKMKAKNFADLVKQAERMGITQESVEG